MTKYLSRKIRFLSLFSMFAVVFIHAYNYKDNFLLPTTTISEGTNPYAIFEYFISNALCRFAVPMFFMFSGYLFFRNFVSIKESYLKKLKSRCFSVLIPYICWVIISGLLVILASQFEVARETQIVQENLVNNFGDFMNFFISPAAFQLWFMQQLLIFFVISPIIYLAIKYTKAIAIIPLIFLWLFDINFLINSQGLLFFCIGAAIAIFKQEMFVTQKDNKLYTLFWTMLWIVLSALVTYFAVTNNAPYIVRLFLYKINEAVGVIAMWWLFDHIFKRLIDKKALVRASNNMFFIYVLHEPLQHFCYQLSLRIGTDDNISHIVLFVFMPICIIYFCIFVSAIVRKISKTLHNVLTGGRVYGGKIWQHHDIISNLIK